MHISLILQGGAGALTELFQPQIYCDLSHFGRDLKGMAELNLQISFSVNASICDATMQKYRSTECKPQTKVTNYLCFLCYLSLSAAYEVIQHVLLSFAISLRHFSLSQHASMSAALPTGS